jgi:hypothetical protein
LSLPFRKAISCEHRWVNRDVIEELGVAKPLPVQLYYALICSFIEMGVFRTLGGEAKSAAELAAAVEVRERALFVQLLDLLATVGVLDKADDAYRLNARVAPMLADEKKATWIMFDRLEASWFDHLGEYLKTGRPLGIHAPDTMTPRQWSIYQRAMSVRPTGKRLAAMPEFDIVPRRILDWAGGIAAVTKPVLDKFSDAHARIIELPNVVALHDGVVNVGPYAGRLEYVAGDVRTYVAEPATYDLVILAAILHHLDRDNARDLLRRSRDCLAPGGIIAIEHGFVGEDGEYPHPLMFLTDILFKVSSGEGEMTFDDFKTYTSSLGLQLVAHSEGILLLKHQ